MNIDEEWVPDEENPDEVDDLRCIFCAMVIWDEVAYGGDLGEGPICAVCWPGGGE